MQYVCMFLSANEPGNIKKIQASVTAARKVFRVMRVGSWVVDLVLSAQTFDGQPLHVRTHTRACTRNILFVISLPYCHWNFALRNT